MKKKWLILWLVLTLFLSTFLGTVAGFWAGRASLSSSPFLQSLNSRFFGSRLSDNQNQSGQAATDNTVAVVEKTSPAVVSVIVSKDLPNIQYYSPWSNSPDLFQQFFGQDFNQPAPQTAPNSGTQKQEIGSGSGFIVSADGLIVTNKHVVFDDQADYTVLTNDGTKYPAKILAKDPLNDLAILKIDAKNLPTLNLGDSSQLKVGQPVIAIGNALGEFTNTVSTGVVSGLSRSVTASNPEMASSENLVGLIQTDASINPGNSGGPLLNSAGEVIGVNVAVAQGAQNIGFALPINQVKASIESVKVSGKIVRPWLGVRYVMVTPDVVKAEKLSVDYGALLVPGASSAEPAVISGSPADKAGLKANDVILEVNGQKIDQNNILASVISGFKPGDAITLKIWRQGAAKDIKVTLEEMK
jgi:serine protease Do